MRTKRGVNEALRYSLSSTGGRWKGRRGEGRKNPSPTSTKGALKTEEKGTKAPKGFFPQKKTSYRREGDVEERKGEALKTSAEFPEGQRERENFLNGDKSAAEKGQ